MENFTFTEGTWVRVQRITDAAKGDKYHRVPTKADGKWCHVFKTTVHGNAFVTNPSGHSALSIRPCDVAEVSETKPVS